MLFAWCFDWLMTILEPLFNMLPSGHLDLPNSAPFINTMQRWDYYVPVWSVLQALSIWVLGVSAYVAVRFTLFVYSLIPGKGT